MPKVIITPTKNKQLKKNYKWENMEREKKTKFSHKIDF